MSARCFLPLVSTACLLVGCAFASSGQAADTLGLDRAVIVTDAAEPSFVQYAVEELAAYLKESTGHDVPVVASSEGGTGVRILVGAKTVQERFPQDLPDAALGDEGYRVKSVSQGGVDYVVATGRTPRGTKLALATLMKAIRLEGGSARVPVPLDEHGKPAFAKRGMHFNGWAFKSPYSFRNWTERDWQRYLDVLAYEGVNLFFLWPFIEIMPVPLSPEDEAYLEECRRVVDYAQKRHGMEVWILHTANRVAQDRCGVADPRQRPYWRPTDSQKDLDPGKPEDFQAIMASREAMYRIINNVDGACNIDSDPGGYPGSTVGDYVKIFQGCRALLDRHNLHGKEAKLIHWMWCGWSVPKGTRLFDEEHQRLMLHGLRDNLPEPRGLINGTVKYLPLLLNENLLSRTVFLPYGAVEREPSYPQTNVRIDDVRAVFVDFTSKHPELAGVMGNFQTPLLQFPHVHFYTSAMWNLDYCQQSERDVLLDVSRHLYPAHRELLADCYLAMKEWMGPAYPTDPAKLDALITKLDALSCEDQLGPLGIFGRKLFPDPGIVARSLRLQLKQYAAYHRLLLELTPTTPRAECERLVGDCLDAHLAWATAHGWHELWGWDNYRYFLAGLSQGNAPVPLMAEKLRENLPSDSELDACLAQVAQRLSAKYDPRIVQVNCIAPLREAVVAEGKQ